MSLLSRSDLFSSAQVIIIIILKMMNILKSKIDVSVIKYSPIDKSYIMWRHRGLVWVSRYEGMRAVLTQFNESDLCQFDQIFKFFIEKWTKCQMSIFFDIFLHPKYWHFFLSVIHPSIWGFLVQRAIQFV